MSIAENSIRKVNNRYSVFYILIYVFSFSRRSVCAKVSTQEGNNPDF